MKSIKELKNPDIIQVNGEKYQVTNQSPNWYHVDKKELEVGIGLVKIGEKVLAPNYSLSYMNNKPNELKFYKWDKNTKSNIEIRIKSLILPK